MASSKSATFPAPKGTTEMAPTMSEAPARRPSGRPPGSGRVYTSTTLRLDPETHRQVIEAARAEEVSVNTWVERAVDAALARRA